MKLRGVKIEGQMFDIMMMAEADEIRLGQSDQYGLQAIDETYHEDARDFFLHFSYDKLGCSEFAGVQS